MASIGILNVGAGDTKLVFDKANPAEVIRSGRIVRDMLRRGYALLVEVDNGKKGKSYQRVVAFDENRSEYIIADFDPIVAEAADNAEKQSVEAAAEGAPGATKPDAGGKPKGRRGTKTRAIPATGASGISVAPSAGG